MSKDRAVERIITAPPIVYQDWALDAGGDVTVAIAGEQRALVYTFEGSVELGGREVRDGQLAVLSDGDAVRLTSRSGGRVLLLAGVPHREPVARHGPFVMNTEQQLVEAFDDYRSGRMGEITRTARLG